MCPLIEGSVFKRMIAEMMVGLQELYISLMVSSSTCSGDLSVEIFAMMFQVLQ